MVIFLALLSFVLAVYLMLGESEPKPRQIQWEGIYQLERGFVMELERTPCGRKLIHLESAHEHASFDVQVMGKAGAIRLRLTPCQPPRVSYGYLQAGRTVSPEFLSACRSLMNTRTVAGFLPSGTTGSPALR